MMYMINDEYNIYGFLCGLKNKQVHILDVPARVSLVYSVSKISGLLPTHNVLHSNTAYHIANNTRIGLYYSNCIYQFIGTCSNSNYPKLRIMDLQ